MYKVAAMGDRDSIYGLAALGLAIFPEDHPEHAAKTLRHLADNGYAVIFMTEKLAAQIPAEVDRYREQSMPAVILIPGVTGNTGQGMQNVSRAVEKAVGSDILKSD